MSGPLPAKTIAASRSLEIIISEVAPPSLAVVRQFMKLMEPLDYDAALKLVSTDCQYTNPPPIGTVTGPAGIRAVLEPFFAPTLENEFQAC